jgi:hypothetical protein
MSTRRTTSALASFRNTRARDRLASADNEGVDTHQFLVGLGLFAWGILVAALGWRIAWDFDRARLVGERRWRIDKGTARRRGLSRDEWLDRWANSQKALAKWVGIPFLAVWFAISVWLMIKAAT